MIKTAAMPTLPPTGQDIEYRAGDNGSNKAGWPGTTRFQATNRNTVIDHATGLEWIQEVPLIFPGGDGLTSLSAQGTWSAAHGTYNVGDLVQGDGAPDALFYVCVLQHAAAGDKEPPNATYWIETVWTASAANLTTPSTMTWNNAIDNSLALDFAGLTDWRCPNWLELASLFDVSPAVAPPIDSVAFPNTPIASYWSSTTQAQFTTQAIIDRWDWSFPTTSVSAKANTYYVRPVRGGILNG